jgi:signal transduction histidine kinase
VLTKEIIVDHTQNFLSFEFTALNYLQPTKNDYKYMLEGFQQEWVDAGAERKTSYSNLQPGEYVFRVIASNNDGVWNMEGASLKIIITPPFWQTWWFIMLSSFLFASSVLLLFRIRINTIKNQKAELERQVKERTEEVIQQKDRVQLRTAELEKANKELEAFTYSVSHDLRAPLRAINGYGQILIEDYSEKLDERGKKTITTIVNNGRKMGQLIDDLLNFSRLGKTEIRRHRIEMNRLVQEALEELRASDVCLPVQLYIRNLAPAWGDGNLIKQVWINLISNAIKYSSTKNEPEIEIGMLSQESRNIYFVKDNGVGFNMSYYQKLFGVFQRLHKEEEFTGTGVGLAIVERIVSRHDGQIWADARENEGAIFYFSLPLNNDL